jgi:hypothetical protein
MKRRLSLTSLFSPCKRSRDIVPQWIYATQLKNYLLNDSLVDWIELYYNRNPTKSNSTFPFFRSFLFEQGHKFEQKIVQQIKERVGEDNVVQISNSHSKARSKILFDQTVEAIKKRVPIIFGGVLQSENEFLYGVSDIIVRNDYISKFVKSYRSKSKDSYYRVIDIKFSTLPLAADKIHILNQDRYPAYKGQLFIYNKILSEIQGFDSGESFILGRGWSSSSKGVDFGVRNPFGKLGKINFKERDIEYVDRSNKAIQWLRDLHRNGSEWKIGDRKEMYPNLAVFGDCYSEKREIAEAIKDVTMLWTMGCKNRDILNENGISSWGDKRCTAELLGVRNKNRQVIIDRMIDINRNVNGNIVYDNLDKCEPIFTNVKKYYIDFEFLGDFSVDRETPLLTVVGIGTEDNGEWSYNSFYIDSLTLESEFQLIKKFYNFIESIKEEYIFIHWGNSEPVQWKNALKRHNLLKIKINWFDLLDFFKRNKIVVKNCFSYSLKEIAFAMHSHELIPTIWDSTSLYSNGMNAMFFTEQKGYVDQKLLEYNEVDCLVLKDIVRFLENIVTLG